MLGHELDTTRLFLLYIVIVSGQVEFSLFAVLAAVHRYVIALVM